jgi:hypothetical protein
VKLSELKPCAVCKGPLPPIWYVLRMSMAFLDRKNTNAVLGLNQIFGGDALHLAEAFAPGAEEAVVVGMDQDKELMREFHICQNCYLMKRIGLAEISEAVAVPEAEVGR